ncbi:uncharacterized protein DUF3791 [Cricetibacter osteomyelitidis]|uniref:Uncharacterized protein DUF3791 n=2 Tax=Cricetibacter osteomyelitidis TaxID=1521931 RepID=A0A4R2T5A6_9PAST|nr:uncharacterized protein DUF3791 [Cricetibacter osteomyelitidis]
MPPEMRFFIYLVEYYAKAKNISGKQVLELFNRLDITRLVYDMYDIYHVERLENAFADIDKLILERA